MTQIALIAPGSVVKRFCWTRPYQMGLAGELRKDYLGQRAYAQFYASDDTSGAPNKYWIMDNGAWEGETLTPDQLLTLATFYGVTEIVAPDVINDAEKTYSATSEFLPYTIGLKVAVVAHGCCLREAQEFIYRIDELDNPRVSTIMIGRAFSRTVSDPTARYTLAAWIHAHFFGRYDIHLLGYNDDWGPDELIACRGIVRSMDTAMPFIETLHGIDLNDPASHGRGARPRQADFFDTPASAFDLRLLQHNIQVLDMWAGQ
jgi:hypothetical protein